ILRAPTESTHVFQQVRCVCQSASIQNARAIRLCVRDDGAGIDRQLLSSGRRKGHYGLPGMRERATSIGEQFDIWSELRHGTDIQVTSPGKIDYALSNDSDNHVAREELTR